jgi:hypothetical protein
VTSQRPFYWPARDRCRIRGGSFLIRHSSSRLGYTSMLFAVVDIDPLHGRIRELLTYMYGVKMYVPSAPLHCVAEASLNAVELGIKVVLFTTRPSWLLARSHPLDMLSAYIVCRLREQALKTIYSRAIYAIAIYLHLMARLGPSFYRISLLLKTWGWIALHTQGPRISKQVYRKPMFYDYSIRGSSQNPCTQSLVQSKGRLAAEERSSKTSGEQARDNSSRTNIFLNPQAVETVRFQPC